MGIYYQDNDVEIRVYSKEELVQQKQNYKDQQLLNRKRRQKTWYQQNKHIQHKKVINKLKTDPLFKLRHNLKNLIRNAINGQGFDKQSKTYQILGCSYDKFKTYIEQQFSEGMSWDNYGDWEYDHKTPVSWAKDEKSIIELNHYTNFQPLWKEDNRSKSNRFSSHPSLLT